MPTLSQVVGALERHVGFPSSRINQVARRLQEAGLVPHGAPGVAPVLDIDHVVDLVIAVAADTTLHAAAEAVRTYRALVPGGAYLDEAPAMLRTDAGEALDIIAEIAVRGDSEILRQDLIEVVTNWPEVQISGPGTSIRYRQQGALASHWGERGHRRSTTINCAALVDALRELFSEEA